MDSKFADLHIHTHFSDGTSTPQEVVQEACAKRLSGIAIVDHDAVEDLPALNAAEGLDLEVIPGIELSAEIDGKDIHILGYFINHTDRELLERLKIFQEIRVERIKKMLEKLREMGIDNISVDEVMSLTESNAVGRSHLAFLLEKKGWISDRRDAFEKYIGEGGPAYESKFKQTPIEAIQLIHSTGGVAVLAHPMANNKDEIIPQLVEAGLDGIEAYYPNCSHNVIEYYRKLAQKYDLVTTGGSDSHGDAKKNTYIGKVKVPYELVEQLRARIRK